MLTETTGEVTTNYTYGLERISAQNSTLKMQYVYDGRGSLAQTVADGKIQSMAYSLFGEMLGSKQSGFGFNAEWYDAATGMQNLRARQYEPTMMRFSQKDILRGWMIEPLSLNRYAYVLNDPVNLSDPSGMVVMNVVRGDVGIGGDGGAAGGAFLTILLLYFSSSDGKSHSIQNAYEAATSGIAGAYEAHRKNARPSSRNRHEEGEARADQDSKKTEKGDASRPPNPNKRKPNATKSGFIVPD